MTEPLLLVERLDVPGRFTESMTVAELESLCSRSYQKVFALITDSQGITTLREVGFVGTKFTPLAPAHQPPLSLPEETNDRQASPPPSAARVIDPPAQVTERLAAAQPASVLREGEADGGRRHRRKPKGPNEKEALPKKAIKPQKRAVAPATAPAQPQISPSVPELVEAPKKLVRKTTPRSISILPGGGAFEVMEVIPGNLKDNDPSHRCFGPDAFK